MLGYPSGIRGDCRSLLGLAGVDRGRLEMMGGMWCCEKTSGGHREFGMLSNARGEFGMIADMMVGGVF